MSFTSSSSSRHRNLIWRNILETVDQLLQGMLFLLLRCDLSTSTSLCLPHEPYTAIFASVAKGGRWPQKHDFLGVPLHPMLSNANLENLFRTLESSIFFPNYKFKITPPHPKKINIFGDSPQPSITFIIQDGCMISPHSDSTPTNTCRLWPMRNIKDSSCGK